LRVLTRWVDDAVRQAVAEVALRARDELARAFYDAFSADPLARPYLTPQMVEARLQQALSRWIGALFSPRDGIDEAVQAAHRQVGDMHARADIPLSLVWRGACLLKLEMKRHLIEVEHGEAMRIGAFLLIDSTIDQAFEIMSDAYSSSHDMNLRNDEAFHLFVVSHNIVAERERQLGALLEWENQLFRALAVGCDPAELRPLSTSAFGLWWNHKAPLIFPQGSGPAAVGACIGRIDAELLPDLARPGAAPDALPRRREVVQAVIRDAEQIKYLVGELFDRLSTAEGGKDPLTQVFNRRFLPSILTREIELFRRRGLSHAVLMVDIDHFKRVNDACGHEAGDRVLQHVAAVLLQRVRSGDFVFRYGGEEFLIVLSEVDAEKAMAIAEKMRRFIESARVLVDAAHQMQVTVSVGCALSDGHPDYERLIQRADRALYAAKAQGRNCCVLADDVAAA
jgi:diguanylate cyclase